VRYLTVVAPTVQPESAEAEASELPVATADEVPDLPEPTERDP
jgi:hypothetical protein